MKVSRGKYAGACVLALCAVAHNTDPAAAEYRARAAQVHWDSAAVAEDVKVEIAFGRELAARVLGRYPLYENAALTQYVNLTGRALARHDARSELEYHFAVLDSDAVNAYAAPGGYIFVTRGAIALMRDEAELAAVLAHEIAHVSRKHIVNQLNIRGGGGTQAGLSLLLGGGGDAARVAMSQAVERATRILFEDGLKQADELEADRGAARLLAVAGYDPGALARFLTRAQALRADNASAIEHTHPPFAVRLAALQKALDEDGLHNGGMRASARFEHRAR